MIACLTTIVEPGDMYCFRHGLGIWRLMKLLTRIYPGHFCEILITLIPQHPSRDFNSGCMTAMTDIGFGLRIMTSIRKSFMCDRRGEIDVTLGSGAARAARFCKYLMACAMPLPIILPKIEK